LSNLLSFRFHHALHRLLLLHYFTPSLEQVAQLWQRDRATHAPVQ